MAGTKVTKKGEEHESTRKGTWFSLGILGAVLLATYILFFTIYLGNL